MTTQQTVFADVQQECIDFLEQLPASQLSWPDQDVALTTWPGYSPFQDWEGLCIPAPVNYVGKGARLGQSLPCALGAALVIVRYLRTAWLWEQVRVKGGAYGAFCLFDALTKGLTLVSYRDPHIRRTLEAFDAAARYLRELKLSEDELNKAVVGAIGELDTHLLPDAKGHTSLRRHLTGQDDVFRQQLREQILATTARDFTVFADALDYLARQGRVVVMGGETALNQAEQELAQHMSRTNVL
jgi:Zn-dependent M16 (insulinase) family peptidase